MSDRERLTKQYTSYKEAYEKFSETEFDWPDSVKEKYKQNSDYVKKQEFQRIFSLNSKKYEKSLPLWFENNGSLKPKYRDVYDVFLNSLRYHERFMKYYLKNMVKN